MLTNRILIEVPDTQKEKMRMITCLTTLVFSLLGRVVLAQDFGSAAFFQTPGNDCRDSGDQLRLMTWAKEKLETIFGLSVPPVFFEVFPEGSYRRLKEVEDKDVVSDSVHEDGRRLSSCQIQYCMMYPDVCTLMGKFTRERVALPPSFHSLRAFKSHLFWIFSVGVKRLPRLARGWSQAASSTRNNPSRSVRGGGD